MEGCVLAWEVRVIQFDEEEVLKAVQDFMATRNGNKDPSTIIHVSCMATKDGVEGKLRSTRTDGGGENNGLITAEDMLVAMLLLCSYKRIRLPIRAVKTLEMHGSTVLLRMTIPSR